MSPLSLLWLFLVVPITSTTVFYFYGTVTCQLNRPSTYQIQVIEEDFATPGDEISRSSFITEQSSPTSYNITAIDTHDGPLNNYFDIVFHVYHDCAYADRRHMVTRVPVGGFEIRGRTYYHEFNFDITQRGNTDDW